MSLFYNPRTAKFESRGGAAVETRTPGALAAFLTGSSESNAGLSDPYNLSPWVRRAIAHIALPIAMQEMRFQAGGQDFENADLLEFWQRPARGYGKDKRMSRFDFVEALVGWLCLKGEYFVILDDTWLAPNAKRSRVIIARPDKMNPMMEDGELLGWSWTDGSGRRHDLIPENVVSSGFWNPQDELRGSAPMSAARMAAEADHAASRFWKSLAESNGDLGETVIAPNGVTPEQEEQIKMAMRRKRAAAKRGKFEPLFVVGDVKTEAPNIQSPDAAAVTQRLQNRHEVFIAFGVPPSFAEVTASYSIGSASDRYKLIEETCQPIAAKIAEGAEEITERLMRRKGISVSFDFSNHSTMQQVRAERMATAEKMHQRGIPWSIINDHLDLGLTPFDGWDKSWLPMNLIDVGGELSAPPPPAEPAPAPGLKAFEELEELLKGCPAHPHQKTDAPDSAKVKRWKGHMRARAPHVKKVRGLIDRALFEARKETLANLAAAEAEEKMIRSGAFDFLFDLAKFLEVLVQPVFRVLVGAYGEAGAELLKNELGSEESFIEPDANGIRRLRARENFLADAGQGVWEEVRDSLEEGINAGESYAKLAERVRGKFNEMSKTRAMRIAVTETSIAFETGRHDAMKQAGAEWKQWLTSEDDRVRWSHAAVDGKTVAMDEPWDVGGFPLMFPCDPEGPPQEIINCRCVHGPVDSPEGGDIEGNNPDAGIPF